MTTSKQATRNGNRRQDRRCNHTRLVAGVEPPSALGFSLHDRFDFLLVDARSGIRIAAVGLGAVLGRAPDALALLGMLFGARSALARAAGRLVGWVFTWGHDPELPGPPSWHAAQSGTGVHLRSYAWARSARAYHSHASCIAVGSCPASCGQPLTIATSVQ